MAIEIIDISQKKKFDESKHHQETVWSDDHGRISMLCLKPGQEVKTHTHHGSHIWTVIEGEGELLSGGSSRKISQGRIVVVPPFEHHGIRNGSTTDLVVVSITAQGD